MTKNLVSWELASGLAVKHTLLGGSASLLLPCPTDHFLGLPWGSSG